MCQVAPEREAVGGDVMAVVPPGIQTPILVRATQDRLPQPAAYPLGVGQGTLEMEVMERETRDQCKEGGHRQSLGPKLPPMLQVPGVGPHGQRMSYPSNSFKPTPGA